MSLPRSVLPALVLTLAASALAGCGASDETPSGAESQPSSIITQLPVETPTPTATPTRTPKPKPTKPAAKPTQGSGDSEGDDEPATAGGGICASLEAADVGAILNGTVRGAGLPGGGCSFDQSDDSAAAATFIETSFAKSPGGMAGAKTEATSSVEGEPEDVSGIGQAAFVVTGTAFGGPDVQGAGAVRVGDHLINVTVSQSAGAKAPRVRALVLSLLRLAVTKLG